MTMVYQVVGWVTDSTMAVFLGGYLNDWISGQADTFGTGTTSVIATTIETERGLKGPLLRAAVAFMKAVHGIETEMIGIMTKEV